MSDLNALFLQGRLTKSAVSSVLSNGSTLLKLSIAVNKDYLDRKSNQWIKKTNFFDVAYYGESAKKNEQEFSKGREVLVEAEIVQNRWEKDGKNYSTIEIHALKVRPLRRPGEGKRTGSENNNQNESTDYDQASGEYAAPPEDNPTF